MPKPPCGTLPKRRRSRYHSKASCGSLCSLIRCEQQVVVVEAFAAADDLAVAFRREHVDAERDLRHDSDPASCRRPSPPTDSGAPSPAGRTPRRPRFRRARRSRRPIRTAGPCCVMMSAASSYEMRGNGALTFSSFEVSRSSAFSSGRALLEHALRRPTPPALRPDPSRRPASRTRLRARPSRTR